jgi:hypothetical protein
LISSFLSLYFFFSLVLLALFHFLQSLFDSIFVRLNYPSILMEWLRTKNGVGCERKKPWSTVIGIFLKKLLEAIDILTSVYISKITQPWYILDVTGYSRKYS